MEKAVLLHPLNERGKRDYGKAFGEKFFESLRPAQASEGMPDRNLVRNTTAQRCAGRRKPEIQRKTKQDNSTTKSLILAQDER